MKKGLAVYIGIDVTYMADYLSYDRQAALEKDEEGSDGVGKAQMLRKSCFRKGQEEVTLFLNKRIQLYLSALRPSKATAVRVRDSGNESAVSH